MRFNEPTVMSTEDINSLNLAEALAVLQKLKAVSPALARLVQDAVGSETQQARPAEMRVRLDGLTSTHPLGATGLVETIEVEPADTYSTLRQKYEEQLDVDFPSGAMCFTVAPPASSAMMYTHGRLLADKTLAELGVHNDATLYLIKNCFSRERRLREMCDLVDASAPAQAARGVALAPRVLVTLRPDVNLQQFVGASSLSHLEHICSSHSSRSSLTAPPQALNEYEREHNFRRWTNEVYRERVMLLRLRDKLRPRDDEAATRLSQCLYNVKGPANARCGYYGCDVDSWQVRS